MPASASAVISSFQQTPFAQEKTMQTAGLRLEHLADATRADCVPKTERENP